ncbi:glycosyltransferase [Propioniciclava sinopodophylli]|uniref:Glycosyltransferase n=2 Tax=Propioniciclava sinopodophylli TaxID=1837344 RepID=A0A4Q9KC75_9ACTN|nr:glycosyltransferase [Propioniciclava sinopodophylli]
MSLAELEQLFQANPTTQTLTWLTSRQWFSHGLVHEPAGVLSQHPELLDALESRDRRTADRILGTARLLANLPQIPPRSRGAAYLPEPGRVLYCVHSTPAYSSNGYSTRTRGVARGMADAGQDVTVVARVGYPWDSSVDRKKPKARRTTKQVDGITYAHIPGADLNATPLDRYLQVAVDAFVREARLTRPAFIQAASNYLTALPALIAARRLGVPFAYEVRGLWEVTEASAKDDWEHSERFRLAVDLESLVAREADVVFAITEEVANVLRERGVDAERIVVAPNAVDPEVFLPLPLDKAYAELRQIRTDVPVVGFAGSIVDYEGLDVLLEASAILTGRGVEHQVVIAGSGPAADTLKKQRDTVGASNVLFLGRLPMDEMPRLMSTFDIMPCPRRSLPVTELVSPLKPLEAFGCGKAVVLTDLSPHRTLAGEGGERALLAPEGDAQGLADVLERLLTERDLRADLGRAARLWVLEQRTWLKVGQKMAHAHAAGAEAHARATQGPARALADLRVGIIADEFTTSTLAASVQLVPIDRTTWRQQVATEQLDLLFVESAWKGNDGAWLRGVGHYSDEESADIRGLLSACRERGIPSVFWNKEDPIHFARFRATAAACDHVFTTDADMIEPYLATEGGMLAAASSLPFYAQPAIHNPLPSERPYEATVAYAGTYYGERYADRSRELDVLLDAALDTGLTIYDRQLGVPNSPYHFPVRYAANIRGVLPYDEVIRSYRTHLAHINVNSVMDSPTMFSRRVVEIAACGGVVLSGLGRGVDETFGGAIPTVADPTVARAYFHAWSTDATRRVEEQWRQLRTVHRSHTIDTALALVARTAGIPATVARAPRYAAVVAARDAQALDSLLAQSVRPAAVLVEGELDAVSARLPHGVAVLPVESAVPTDVDWVAQWTGGLPRTHAEDLLIAAQFGTWERITARPASSSDAGAPLLTVGDTPRRQGDFVRAGALATGDDLGRVTEAAGRAAEWLVAPRPAQGEDEGGLPASAVEGPRRILVAGHDLKFARGLIAELEAQGHTVLIDQWRGHNQHDEEASHALLAQADVVFCEWGLGNLVWYSRHVADHQRLVVRVHAQEITLPYLALANHQAVDQYIFVGELMRRAAVTSHGVPQHKARVVPNPVDVEALTRPKEPGAERNIGFVGIVPRAKRFDLALDVLDGLLKHDKRYRLFVKGKLPSDYPWMSDRPDEMAWYDSQFARVDQMLAAEPGCIVFDGFGDNMAEWYSKIGVALSVSDHESFHLTLADGAVSGALPASLAWPGSDLVYPAEWLSPTVDSMVRRILTTRRTPHAYATVAADRFASPLVLDTLKELIVG